MNLRTARNARLAPVFIVLIVVVGLVVALAGAWYALENPLYSLSTPVAALMALAESFTPRFERRGSLVVLDLSGLTRLFGSIEEMAEHLTRYRDDVVGAL